MQGTSQRAAVLGRDEAAKGRGMFDWITGFLEQGGYLAVAFLMFLENVFPPIPSELVMPLAGFTAAQGETRLIPAILAGTAGSLAGAVVWFYAGRWLGAERLKQIARRHGRWLTMTPGEVDRACAWFGRYGGRAVFLGRMVPAVRTLISVPAGIAGMSLPRLLLYSALGTLVWTAALAVAGYLLESQYDRVAEWMNPVSNAVLVGLVGWYLWRVATFGRRVRQD
jgi:membrane protein DedA with SNARE-associated domain